MNNVKIPIVVVIALLLLISQVASAVPTFQTYIVGSWAGSYGPDEQTWFSNENPFELIVAGAYQASDAQGNSQKATASLTQVKLLLSVPVEQEGTISFLAGGATLVADGFDKNLLTDVAGNDGYSKTSLFFPEHFNQHYPLHDDISNYLVYDIGDFFPPVENAVSNYDAETGTIQPNVADGVERSFTIFVTGFDRVHIDAFGLETYVDGTTNWKNSWDWNISPGSHDATYIPAPGAILLGGIGVGLVAWLRRRRTL